MWAKHFMGYVWTENFLQAELLTRWFAHTVVTGRESIDARAFAFIA